MAASSAAASASIDERREGRSASAVRVAVVWFGSRIAVFIAATYSTWVLAGDPTQQFGSDPELIPAHGPISTWYQWDVVWYAGIAQDGYGAPGAEYNYAFPPGFPGLLWVFGKLNVHPTLAGLAISLAAGFIAAVALARLTTAVGGRGELAVVAWVLAPTAVYLAAPYPEALFCAFAFWAWLRAREGAWVTASLLACAAMTLRMNGIFLALALIVLFLTGEHRRWRVSAALLLPFATLLAIFAWYRSRTGSWLTWFESQEVGWHRHFQNPIDTLTTTIDYAFSIGQTATFNIQYRLELAAMVAIVLLAVAMLVLRWWGEATYLLATAIALGSSSLYYSVPRATLVLFPIWMLVGVWMTRWRSAAIGYVVVAAPLMFVGVIGFVNGRWIA